MHRIAAATLLGLVVIAALVAGLVAGTGASSRHHHGARPGSTGTLPSGPAELAGRIDRAQAIIDDPSRPARELARAGFTEQLSTRALQHEPPPTRRATLALLGPRAAAGMRADLAAAGALSGIGGTPPPGLPRWQIVQPPAPETLLSYFREAQRRFGVPWEDLAAIELIETHFGRIHGLSAAGAQGPMQFMPATWARFGHGRVDNQHDAILGAARLLKSNGAPGDMAGALYHYNNSVDYVHAVEDYASRMRADARAYYGYYYWQVLYARRGATVILPVGYPRVRPMAAPLTPPDPHYQ